MKTFEEYSKKFPACAVEPSYEKRLIIPKRKVWFPASLDCILYSNKNEIMDKTRLLRNLFQYKSVLEIGITIHEYRCKEHYN